MAEKIATNIENNQDQIFRPHLQKAKRLVLGEERPTLFTQIVFYIGVVVTSIFGMWSTISFLILKFPDYLKSNKQVDVAAIVSLRAKELGFESQDFYSKLVLYHLSSVLVWGVILVCLFFLWRGVKWAGPVIISGILGLTIFMLVLLGATYLIEDTTTFDKVTLLVFVLLLLISHYTRIPQDKTTVVSSTLAEKEET